MVEEIILQALQNSKEEGLDDAGLKARLP